MWLIDSPIGRKFIMSISGIFLVLFLLFHSCMNIVVIISPESYNQICAFLGANWYAVIGSLVLALGFVVHILYALYLSFLNLRARGEVRYAVKATPTDVEWSSKHMLILGVIIVGFIVLHLYNFWFKMQFAELSGIHTGAFDPQNGAAYVSSLFSHWIYCVLYIIWLVALWLHLTHGVWSALHSLGLNNKKWLPRIRVIGNVVSTIIVLMFMSVPIYYLIVNILQ
ncbi:MAG TPA: succinate dehydrogenase cytochrome b subunit [Paludibacteraceae bacterium]|nr:succinate dehydrogenase cytochrome b subunit [Paludibacteraceae bacterium]